MTDTALVLTLPDTRDAILSITGDSSLTTNEIGERLGELRQQAQGDERSLLLIDQAWERVQSLNHTAHAAIDIALAIRAMADTAVEQRDHLIGELDEAYQERDAIAEERDNVCDQLEDWNEALSCLDYEHPVVGTVVESVEEEAREHWDDELYNDTYRMLERHGIDPNQTTDLGDLLPWHIIQLLNDDVTLTDHQRALFTQFVTSLIPEEHTPCPKK